jgi:hypothetical protein
MTIQTMGWAYYMWESNGFPSLSNMHFGTI